MTDAELTEIEHREHLEQCTAENCPICQHIARQHA